MSPLLVANLTAAAVVVVARVDQAPVPATYTRKKPGPNDQIKVTLSVLDHAVKLTKMAYGNETCDGTEYLANKQNVNVKQVIFHFPSSNFSACVKAQWKSHRRSLQK